MASLPELSALSAPKPFPRTSRERDFILVVASVCVTGACVVYLARDLFVLHAITTCAAVILLGSLPYETHALLMGLCAVIPAQVVSHRYYVWSDEQRLCIGAALFVGGAIVTLVPHVMIMAYVWFTCDPPPSSNSSTHDKLIHYATVYDQHRHETRGIVLVSEHVETILGALVYTTAVVLMWFVDASGLMKNLTVYASLIFPVSAAHRCAVAPGSQTHLRSYLALTVPCLYVLVLPMCYQYIALCHAIVMCAIALMPEKLRRRLSIGARNDSFSSESSDIRLNLNEVDVSDVSPAEMGHSIDSAFRIMDEDDEGDISDVPKNDLHAHTNASREHTWDDESAVGHSSEREAKTASALIVENVTADEDATNAVAGFF